MAPLHRYLLTARNAAQNNEAEEEVGPHNARVEIRESTEQTAITAATAAAAADDEKDERRTILATLPRRNRTGGKRINPRQMRHRITKWEKKLKPLVHRLLEHLHLPRQPQLLPTLKHLPADREDVRR